MQYFLRSALPVILYSAFAKVLGSNKHLKRARVLQRLEERFAKFTDAFRHLMGMLQHDMMVYLYHMYMFTLNVC